MVEGHLSQIRAISVTKNGLVSVELAHYPNKTVLNVHFFGRMAVMLR